MKEIKMKNIAIVCSGGDVSGMNAALKRFVEYSIVKGLRPYFVYNGYEGLIDNTIGKATYSDVSGIISKGGTKIQTSRSTRFLEKSYRTKAIENLKSHNITSVIVLGGDGSFKGMQKLFQESTDISFSGIPATIDNDIAGTDYCLGVDTALNVIKFSIDSIRDTASSFNRAFIVETMGRECGYLALVSAITSGAELCLVPEVPYTLDTYKSSFKKQIKEGRTYFLVVMSEALDKAEETSNWFEKELGIESRVTVLGHIQRGGNTTVHDRLMAFHFISESINGLLAGEKCSVICYSHCGFQHKPIEEVAYQKSHIKDEILKLGCVFWNKSKQ